MYKFFYLTFFSLYFVLSLEAVVVQNYRGGPYNNYPSSTYYYQNPAPSYYYSPNDPRYPYNRSAFYYNYDPFRDADRHEQIFESNKK